MHYLLSIKDDMTTIDGDQSVALRFAESEVAIDGCEWGDTYNSYLQVSDMLQNVNLRWVME